MHIALPRRQAGASGQQGFTLIELMIAVAIVAILAGIALPSYSRYVVRGKLSQATSQLSGLAISLQQYYQDNRSYAGACVAGSLAPLPTTSTGDFTYACPTLTAAGFSATATGNVRTPVSGFVFSIDHNGNRATTAAPAGWQTSASCWITNSSGGCN